MGKKMKISSLFKSRGGILTVPLCNTAKTLSFRVADDVFKTVNSVFFDQLQQNGDALEAETPESWFTNSSETASFSTESDHDLDAESLETVVRGVVRSERLFFEPGVTSSIMEEKEDRCRSKKDDRECSPLEEISVAVAMESENPYGDFRRSMEEMVRSHEELVKDWECLEAMLGWYLRMNGRRNHGVIVSAFVDLLVGLAGGGESASASDSACYSTAVSSFPSSPLYSSQGQNEIEEEEEEEARQL